jgi:acyl-CoA thioesterase-1
MYLDHIVSFHRRSLSKPWLKTKARGLVASVFICLSCFAAYAEPAKTKILVLGDSLTAGYQLPLNASFPPVLEARLRAKGLHVDIINASVSGDTASGGLERLEWSLAAGADAVIVELGANDMLRGIDVEVTYAALDSILDKLKQRNIPVLLAGMKAARGVGAEYRDAFDSLYPRLAARHGALLYPFFLEGVAGRSEFNLPDGIHPNAAGVRRIVEGIEPLVEELIRKTHAATPTPPGAGPRGPG